MQRALIRAGADVWHTEGFNPHIYMTFALPLALGIAGLRESMDLRLSLDSDCTPEQVDFREVAEKLNAVMPQGLCVSHVAVPVHKANEIQKARYEIRVGQFGMLDEFLSQSEILIEKKTKRSLQVIDVKPLLEWESGVLTLPAGNELNINPWNVLGDRFDAESVTRTAILCEGGVVFE
jgi:radical SAM-linked protein